VDRDEVLKPYALAIGYLTIEWNLLHSNLSMLFSRLMTNSFFGPAHYVWDSTPSDRSQREMLRAVIKSNHTRKKGDKLAAELVTEIEWLLRECDILAEQRNNAIHSVYMPVEKKGAITTAFLPFSKRTAIMGQKADPLAELLVYRTKAGVLARFAGELAAHKESVPKRPKLSGPPV
jgi:hypothetical protein